MNSPTPPPPASAAWTGPWDDEFHDRVFGTDPVVLGPVAAMLTGLQHRDGSTITGVALRVEGAIITGVSPATVAADLTPTQARELAETLIMLADRAETLDGLA
jgi:hypothetical protein